MSALLRSWSCILKPPELPMPRTGGGGTAMMKASWMACIEPNSVPMIWSADWPAASRSSNESKAAKITPALLALVKVAPEKPAKATASLTPGVLLDDLGRLLHDLVGSRQRGAVRQLHDHDGIALVERRDEAGRHGLDHVHGRVDQRAEDGEHGKQRRPCADKEAHEPRIAMPPCARTRG